MAVKRVVQDVLDRSPRLQALTPPKTREVVQWCRQRGYTPPDLEPQRKNDDESIEDILTQIDNEPGEFVSAFGTYPLRKDYLLWLVFAISQSARFFFPAAQSGSMFSLQCCMCGCSSSAVTSWSSNICSPVVCEGGRCAASMFLFGRVVLFIVLINSVFCR